MSYITEFEAELSKRLLSNETTETIVRWISEKVLESYRNGITAGQKGVQVIRKGKRMRSVQTLPIGFHPVFLEVAIPRCQCNTCGQIFEIAPPFARLTRTTRKRLAGLFMV